MFDNLHITVAAEKLFSIGPIPITNSYLTGLIVMALLVIVGRLASTRVGDVPNRFQSTCELIIEYLLNLTEIAGGRRLGRMTFPLIGTLFLFIITANYSGLLPGVGTIGFYRNEEVPDTSATSQTAPTDTNTLYKVDQQNVTTSQTQSSTSSETTHTERVLVPWFRAPNADLNQTLAMALVSWFTVQILGIRLSGGFLRRMKHMAEPAFLFPIELIQEFFKLISLAARLFGNIFAGEVVLTLLYTFAAGAKFVVLPLFLPVVFFMLEALFGFIQAVLFSMLTLIYIKIAAGSHDEEHGDELVSNAAPEFPEAAIPGLTEGGRA